MSIIEKAKLYGIHCHQNTNHTYDGKPYSVHLEMVFLEAKKYAHILPEDLRDDFLAAAWVHDVIEDCRQTYGDVLTHTNQYVADLVFAVTNEKGKYRKERANHKYYSDMREVDYAPLLKICDRLANLKYSISKDSLLTVMYVNELPNFIKQVSHPDYQDAISELVGISAAHNLNKRTK